MDRYNDDFVELLAKELCRISGSGDPERLIVPIELLSMSTPHGPDGTVLEVPLWKCFELQARFTIFFSMNWAAERVASFSTYDGSVDQNDIALALRKIGAEIWPHDKPSSDASAG